MIKGCSRIRGSICPSAISIFHENHSKVHPKKLLCWNFQPPTVKITPGTSKNVQFRLSFFPDAILFQKIWKNSWSFFLLLKNTMNFFRSLEAKLRSGKINKVFNSQKNTERLNSLTLKYNKSMYFFPFFRMVVLKILKRWCVIVKNAKIRLFFTILGT